MRKRVFVSFDFDNDSSLHGAVVGQSKNPDSPFRIVDCSLKEEAPTVKWEARARRAIKGADIVLVMVGVDTFRASGVLKEVKMARDEQIPVVQVIGYSDALCTRVPNAGRRYAWTWENLKKVLG